MSKEVYPRFFPLDEDDAKYKLAMEQVEAGADPHERTITVFCFCIDGLDHSFGVVTLSRQEVIDAKNNFWKVQLEIIRRKNRF